MTTYIRGDDEAGALDPAAGPLKARLTTPMHASSQ
jgi:hypothetical protein